MKKYLIRGALALVVCGCMISCQDHDEFVGNVIQAKTQAFDEAFVEAYGEIQPGHDWGFGSVGQAARTRSGSAECIKKDYTNFPRDIEPAAISNSERAYVKKWFEDNSGLSETGFDFTNFFIQHVWGQAAKEYTVWYQNSQNNNAQEDYTETATMDYFEVGDGTTYCHVLDFNANSGGTWGIVYMKNSSALSFGFHSTWGDNRLYHNFKCAHIQGTADDGTVIDGYYVGLAMYGEKEDNGTRKLNEYEKNIADDWILKIVPGVSGSSETPTIPQVYVVDEGTTPSAYYEVWTGKKVVDIGRVMAEDLGSSDKNDMDYNDVVFEARIVRPYTEIRKKDSESSSAYETVSNVTINGTNYYAGEESAYANIKLLAAGGTIPIEVAGIDVHNAFGGEIGKTTMINTENPNMTNGTYATRGATDLEKVGGSKDFDYSSIDDIPITAQFANNTVIIDNSGSVPHKIRVPTEAPWPIERVEMNTAYGNKFGSGLKGATGDGYVQDRTVQFWNYAVSGNVNNLEGFGQRKGDVFDETRTASGTVNGQTTYTATLMNAVNTTYPTVESGWTIVWTRGDNDGYLYYDGSSHGVDINSANFNGITVGSKVRIYGVYRSGFNVYTGIGNRSETNYNQSGYIELDVADNNYVNFLTSNGLTITGSNFTVTNVAIKVAAVEPTHVEATPGENETDLITSTIEFTGYSNEVIANSLFSDAKQYTILRIYGWATGESSNYSIQTGNNTGGFISETYCTQNSDVSMTTNGYIELQLTKAGASKLKEVGLMLTGQNFKFSHITIDNSQIPARETYASGSTISLFEGTKQRQHGWGEESIEVDKSYFSKAKAGDVIRITCSYWHDPNGSNDGKWRITLKGNADSYTFISPDPWYGGTDGYHTNDNNPSHFDATKGLMTFTLSETSVSILEDCGLNISFGGLSITSVDLFVP